MRAAPSKDDARRARKHFTEFAASRRGVEAFVEPATHVTADDGHPHRRTTASGRGAPWPRARTGSGSPTELQLPTYDVNQTGYPQRMRDWNARQRGR